MDMLFAQGEEIVIRVLGKKWVVVLRYFLFTFSNSTIFLTGYYVPDSMEEDPYGSEEDDEEAYSDEELLSDDLVDASDADIAKIRARLMEMAEGEDLSDDEDDSEFDSEEDEEVMTGRIEEMGDSDEEDEEDEEEEEEEEEEAVPAPKAAGTSWMMKCCIDVTNVIEKRAAPEPKKQEPAVKKQKQEAAAAPVKKEAVTPVKKEAPKKEEPKKEAKEEPKKKTLPSGLVIEEMTVGTGARAKNGKRVCLMLLGWVALLMSIHS